MNLKKEKLNNSGQALLVVVLVMIIALTVGLSLISRSITSVKTSTEQASSQKALAAAEAGVEQAIKNNTSIAQSTFGSDTKYQTQVTAVSGTTFLINGGDLVQRDDSADVWMSDYATDSAKLYANPISSNITVDFGTSSNPCTNPAIVVDVISGGKNAPVLNKYSYDPCISRRSSNNFSAPVSGGDTVSAVTFTNKTQVINVSSGLFFRVTPVYADTKMAIISSVPLPSQGSVITSTATSGNTKRSIKVFQGYPKIPAEFFPYSLFSP